MSGSRKPLSFGSFVSDKNFLDKKIPENPKYKHVKPATDSGPNVQKLITSLKARHRDTNSRPDEIYRRIKLTLLAKLLVTVSEHSHSEENESEHNENSKENGSKNTSCQRNTFLNLTQGIGERDLHNVNTNRNPQETNKILRPYLLLDVRDYDEYLKCHIITAIHYPVAMLSRTVGYETPELVQYKNSADSIIIVYDEDEELIASRVAKTLSERGYDNIYLLSGGIKMAKDHCPRGLLEFWPPHLERVYPPSMNPKYTPKENLTKEDVDGVMSCLNLDSAQQGEPRNRSCSSSRVSSRLNVRSRSKNPATRLSAHSVNALSASVSQMSLQLPQSGRMRSNSVQSRIASSAGNPFYTRASQRTATAKNTQLAFGKKPWK